MTPQQYHMIGWNMAYTKIGHSSNLPDLKPSQSFNFGAAFQYFDVSNFLILQSPIRTGGLQALTLLLSLLHVEKFSLLSPPTNLMLFLRLEKKKKH